VLARLVEAEETPSCRSDEVFSEALARAASDPALALGDDDLHLALYLSLEVHYRSFPETGHRLEWDPALLECRVALEQVFLDGLARAVIAPDPEPERVAEALFELAASDEMPSLSRWIERSADLAQFREFAIHRSAYQLKEADPHSWLIPRLTAKAKVALLEVQFDEYGGGQVDRMHSALYAKTMRTLALADAENAYLDCLPGATLATVNLISVLSLRANMRGAAVGHLAMFEINSAAPNRRYGNALRRLGFDADATDFYDEHVEADSVHENIAAHDLAGSLAQAEPELAGQILFGAGALLELDRRFTEYLLGAWKGGMTSLLALPGGAVDSTP